MVDVQSVASSLSLDCEAYQNFQQNTMYQSTDVYSDYEQEVETRHSEAAESVEDFFQNNEGPGYKAPVIQSDWKEEEANNRTDNWNIFRKSNTTKPSASHSTALSDDSDDGLESDRTFPDRGLLTSVAYSDKQGPSVSQQRMARDDTPQQKNTTESQVKQSYTTENMKAKVSVDDWMRQERMDRASLEDDNEEETLSVLSTDRTFDNSEVASPSKKSHPQTKGSEKNIHSLNEKKRTTFDAWQTKNKAMTPETSARTVDNDLDLDASGQTWRSNATDVNGIEKELDEIQLTPHPKAKVEEEEADYVVEEMGRNKGQTRSSFDDFVGNTAQSGSNMAAVADEGQGSHSRSSFEAWREHREVSKPGVTMETARTDSSLNTDVLLQGYKDKPIADDSSGFEPMIADDFVASKTIHQTYSQPQKSQTLHNSDVSRKYDSYMNHHGGVNSNNELKREFVKEMLTRAKDRQSEKEDLYSNTWKPRASDPSGAAARTSSESAKHYPRGVTLSKTFTKTSNYTQAGRKWDSSKFDELAYGPSNVFQKDAGKKSSHLGSYGTSKKYFQTDFTTKNWKIHGNKGLIEDNKSGNKNKPIQTVSDLGEENYNGDTAPVNVSVIDESYYKGLLVSSPIPRFSDSDSDALSPIQSPEIIPAALTNQKSLHRRNDFKSSTYARPHSANSIQSRNKSTFKSNTSTTKQTSAKKPANQPAESMGLSVEGVKQDTGPRRPNSAIGRYRTNHNPSFVDETLFGSKQAEPSFEAPWGEPDKLGKKPLPYVAITSMEPHLDRKTLPAKNVSRPGSAKSRPVSASSKKKQTKELHNFQQAYIDETLFTGGGKTDYTHSAPGFKAPWNENQREPKPHAFDATDYRAVNARKRSQAASENKKPVWK